MARVPAKRKDLKNSFKKHYNVYKTIKDASCHPMSKRMLLFYAVESGLKCLLLDQIHKNTTLDLQEYHGFDFLKKHGHDINKLLKLVKIGDSKQYMLTSIPVPRSWPPRTIEPEELHQIWRYGIEMGITEQEKQAEEKLRNIAAWLDDNRV